MSRRTPMNQQAIDPGGEGDPKSYTHHHLLEGVDFDKLTLGNKLFETQVPGDDGRIDSIDFTEVQTHLQDSQQYPGTVDSDGMRHLLPGRNEQHRQHSSHLTGQNEIADVDTTPQTSHTIDGHAIDGHTDVDSAYLSLNSYNPSLSNYSDIQSADFSSLGSFSLEEPCVTLRQNSTRSLRPQSETIKTTSKQSVESGRAESWHEDSDRQKLQEFSQKMSYTPAEFQKAMADIGEETPDHDKLLRHLVKLRDNQSTKSEPVTQEHKKLVRARTSISRTNEGDTKGFRHIVIDGSNVAMEHGLHQVYSCRGIQIAVQYFQNRGHEAITVFIPAHRLKNESHETKDQHVLNELARCGVVVKTPSRKSSKGHIASYEDRFILKLASSNKAIVVSNDHFRDLKGESADFKETIETRLLPFVFANNQFIPAEDPLGKRGPTLEQFLRVDPLNAEAGICPYGRKCTYGTKCKYGHPERQETYGSALGTSSYLNSEMPQISQQTSQQMQQQTSRHLPQQQSQQLPQHMSQSQLVSQSGQQPPQHWNLPHRQRDVYNVSKTQHLHYAPPVPPHTYNSSQCPMPSSGYYSSGYFSTDYYSTPSPYGSYMSSSAYAADYPPTAGAGSHPPQAARAYIHLKNNESYKSLPTEDNQGAFNHSQQQALVARNTEIDSSVSDFTHSLMSGSMYTSAPHSLTENVTDYHGMLPTYQQEPLVQPENTVANKMQLYSRPITKSDPRYKTYFHLKSLFPEKIVRKILNKFPNVSDPNRITEEVLFEMKRCKC